MRIAIIGTGYVGLVSGACFADIGHHVTCVDTDSDKITKLLTGDIPIYEPSLEELVARNVAAERLSFTTSTAEAVQGAQAIFIAVGTPPRPGDGHADLSYIFRAAENVANALTGYTVIVDKSTVPVGTARHVSDTIRQINPDAEFDVASNPEFLREGAAIADFMQPDRVVVGVDSSKAQKVLEELYRPLTERNIPLLVTGLESAELIKYAANAFLAVKIAYINEIADLCEQTGADVREVAKGMGTDSRIGDRFLLPGPGYGGSCFPKDTRALLQSARNREINLHIVEAAITSNDTRKRHMAERVIAACGGSVRGKTIAVLGLTFKAGTDDMRDSPALDIVPALQRAGATIRAHDPKGMRNAVRHLGAMEQVNNVESVLKDADCAVIITEWEEFRSLSPERLKDLMTQPIVVDLRNLYDPAGMRAAGIVYRGIGISG